MSRKAIWAILAPTSASWLQARWQALRDEEFAHGEAVALAGSGAHAALVTYDPQLTDAEFALAEQLAEELGQVVWTIRPIDAIELGPDGAVVWKVEPGGQARDEAGDPFALAERLGLDLRPR